MKRIRFGKYDLIEKIASGGMAEIFLAKQSGVGGFSKIVVIKSIHKHLSGDSEFVAMFINEARVAAQLTHQNIVQIYDFGEFHNSHYIAMEYIHGKDLKALYKRCRLTNTKLPIELSIHIIQQICNGLDFAHRKRDMKQRSLNIVHRDVSPQNILLSYEGEVKITDFGIAKATTQLRATQAGTLKGKIAYMSPEQAWGKEIDRRSDIFAIGIIFYEILTLKRLFLGSSDLETLENVRNVKIPSLHAQDPAIPLEIERIILKATEKNILKRYQNAREMYQDLERFCIQNGFLHQPYRLAEFMRQMFLDKHDSPATQEKLPEINHIATSLPPKQPRRSRTRNVSPRKVNKIRRSLHSADASPLKISKEEQINASAKKIDDKAANKITFEKKDAPVIKREKVNKSFEALSREIFNKNFHSQFDNVKSVFKNDKLILRIIFVAALIFIGFSLVLVHFWLNRSQSSLASKATLRFSCNVINARIYFDQRPLGKLEQKTYLLKSLPTGEHTLFIKADGYNEFSKKLFFKFGETKVLDITLKPYTGTLSIAANMDNVKVFLRKKDAQLSDKTAFTTTVLRKSTKSNPLNYIIDEIPVGTYILEIKRNGFTVISTEITVLKEKITYYFATVPEVYQKWTLSITSNIADAVILIDNISEGLTRDFSPIKIELSEGKHVLKLAREGYENFRKEINLTSDLPIYAELQPKTENTTTEDKIGSSILLTANVSGIIIFIDGHRIMKTHDLVTTIKGIPVGKHELVATKTGFRLITKNFEITDENLLNLTLEMIKEKKYNQ